MTPYILAYSLALSIVAGLARSESVDMIEVNHVHSSQGNLCFTQLIFWGWDYCENKYHVRAWSMLDATSNANMMVNYRSNRTHIRWSNIADKVSRDISAIHFRESWTQHDPERQDAANNPGHQRIGFRK